MKVLSMDLGKSKTVGCMFDTSDATHTFSTVAMLPERIKQLIELARTDRVVFEVCTDAGWVADVCRELDVRFEAVNPATLTHVMHRCRTKTDRKDALDLAAASAMNKTRSVHIPLKPVREWRALMEQRAKAVERRTGRRIQTRAVFQLVAIPIPGGQKTWSAKGMATLADLAARKMDPADRDRVLIALDGLRHEDSEIAALQDLLDAIAAKDPGVQLLQTVPGVGPRLAETVVAALDGPRRFRNAKQVGCYSGLTSRQNQSGATDRSSCISPAGRIRQLRRRGPSPRGSAESTGFGLLRSSGKSYRRPTVRTRRRSRGCRARHETRVPPKRSNPRRDPNACTIVLAASAAAKAVPRTTGEGKCEDKQSLGNRLDGTSLIEGAGAEERRTGRLIRLAVKPCALPKSYEILIATSLDRA
ncbi:MAG: transposase [Phycisphaerae bacterium]|nr:transposase [Phycisphaerae bacterium]